jgi:serine/threonine-protein kinase
MLWTFATRGTSLWVLGPPFLTRMALASIVAVIAMSKLSLTPRLVKALEIVLFGGITSLLCFYQYHINLHFLREGNILGPIMFTKNGILQLVVLMVLYGMVIPNNARSASGVVLTMALALVATFTLLITHPAVMPLVAEINQSEPIGTDLIIILAGAALAIFGAHVLNGLRCELHEARRFGQYQLGKRLGVGGMGEVYLAEHQMLKRACALKLIRPDAVNNPIALARFEREVQAAARLTHPNTIEIFDYGHTEDGTFYYVMEFLPGMTLEDMVREFGPLAPPRLIYLLIQTCGALAEAHSLGLVHRDLKPSNIFVALRGGQSDVAKLLDFGLVKLTQDPSAPQLTGDQVVSGTPHYMSPEQATGQADLDHRTDIYALGAVAYFALTGQPPFTGQSAMNVMIAHVRDEAVPPSSRRPEIPHDLELIVLRCLAKKPEDRFGDVKELARALAACECAGEWDADRADAWWIAAARSRSGGATSSS